MAQKVAAAGGELKFAPTFKEKRCNIQTVLHSVQFLCTGSTNSTYNSKIRISDSSDVTVYFLRHRSNDKKVSRHCETAYFKDLDSVLQVELLVSSPG